MHTAEFFFRLPFQGGIALARSLAQASGVVFSSEQVLDPSGLTPAPQNRKLYAISLISRNQQKKWIYWLPAHEGRANDIRMASGAGTDGGIPLLLIRRMI
jgi:hypothetical protein